ncbi:MAG: ABC transporter ATP-binding protein [Bacteroidia bacterium]
MLETEKIISAKKARKPSMLSLLKPYSGLIIWLIVLTFFSNGISLVIPKIIANGIDSFSAGHLIFKKIIFEFGIAAVSIFIFTYLQSIVQTYASERVARDLRQKLSAKISQQSYAYVEKISPSRLLTNLTSDVDAIKTFVSQAIVSIASSLFIIIGASALLISINWRLALAVLTIIPIIGAVFYFVLVKVRVLFKRSQGVIDWLNKVINESVLGAALIRVLNSQQPEYDKFISANKEALGIGLSILRLFATLIPLVTFVSNLAMLTVLALGGHFVIGGTMTLGDFAAFNSYIALLIFPIIMIGFMSNVIAMASASYQRIQNVLEIKEVEDKGSIKNSLKGNIELENITVTYGDIPALKEISFSVKAGTKTAIIGPTAAGKTQLFYLLTGLIQPEKGSIKFDNNNIADYNKESFYSQIGFVFQDSIIFNMSMRENIAFNKAVTDEAMQKAIATAELDIFIEALPEKMDTVISERGNSLSGGQKQRVMLARALAINPKILLLDDFTARVDAQTEKKILANVRKNYPDITLLSITQQIDPVKEYDQIILLMQGELVAKGTHETLLKTSPEYVQIYQSQRSTSSYEV